jgi:Ca-activated chloride channel family protein
MVSGIWDFTGMIGMFGSNEDVHAPDFGYIDIVGGKKMAKGNKEYKLRRIFSLIASLVLVLNILVGISLQVPNVDAAFRDHNVGNLNLNILTDYGRALEPLSLDGGGYQTVRDGIGFSYMGLVIDQDNYNHVPGTEDIAECYEAAWPYAGAGDFATQTPISFLIDDGITQKSYGSYQNTGTADPNDILVDQTAWSVQNRDWLLLQWRLTNQKVVPITGVSIGLEIPISKVGASGGGGPGGDNGDDVDGYDAGTSTYWASDDGGTTLGFASAVPTDPITHYYAEDYQVDYMSEYINFYANETWLYNRLTAPSATATNGVTPGNITATVGWDGFDIPAGESKTFTMVIAINDTFANMQTTVLDAQDYYHYVATNFLITEIRDSGSATPRIEVFNFGRPPTDPIGLLSLEANVGPLTGSWSANPIPTYGYSYFTPNENIDSEGDTITLYESAVQIDQMSYGQDGIAPDPLNGESTGRWYNPSTASYTDDWVRDPNPTWDAQNDVGTISVLHPVVINRVLFNPLDPAEGYVELMYTGSSSVDISGYKIVCDDEFVVPGGTILDTTNRFYVLPESAMAAFFANMDTAGDNVYFYDDSDNLIDMVGWSSAHNQGEYMTRTPDGAGTYQGYDDTTSGTAGWIFDNLPYMIVTEFYTDPTTAQIEIYNPRGGEKVLDSIPQRWTFNVSSGQLTGGWSVTPIPAGGYSTFTLSAGTPGDEGDTISFYYNGGFLEDVSYGTSGIAPDPLSTESTARYWNSTSLSYHDEWTREDTPTFDAQNDVNGFNWSSYIVINEVIFNPAVDPDGKCFVLTNRFSVPGVSIGINIMNYVIVSDADFQMTWDITLFPGDKVLIPFGSDPAGDNFFNEMTPSSDTIYLYDSNGLLLDMVGWTSPHLNGMAVRRVPDGFGTQDGHDDASSVAAGWVFDSPLEVQITEVSDSESAINQIEIFNLYYPDIDFGAPGIFELRNGLGAQIPGTWTTPIAAPGDYAVYQAVSGLDFDSDTISVYQRNILGEQVGYGTHGVVPDPLQDESTAKYFAGWDYDESWGRNWTLGPTWGLDNDIPQVNQSSSLVLNEVLFNPASPGDMFIELYLRWGWLNLTGYKIVADTVFTIPFGEILSVDDRYYYFTESMDPAFFANLDVNGDNIYLYDDNGTFLDMVGWSSSHSVGDSVCRVPTGNGTRNGYDDTSSYLAGWRFGCLPSIQLVKLSVPKTDDEIKYGSFGSIIIYNLTVTNKQGTIDNFLLLLSSINGYPMVVMDETWTTVITSVSLLPGESINITVVVTLPSVIPFIAWDNITLTAQSENASLFRDTKLLGSYVSPFIWPDKWADPTQIYIAGTGHDEQTTLTLNLTGMGSVVELINPQDVIFCVDTSGSMSQIAIDIIKEGLTGYVDEMDNPDQGAVVTFGGSAQILNQLTQDYTQLKNDIASIPGPGGGTFMVGALQLAITELRQRNMSGHIQVIILLTDGVPSDGTADDVRNMAQLAAQDGIMIFTIGLEPAPGFPALDEVLLNDVANITGGLYFYAPTASELPAIYKLIAAYIGDIAGRDNNVFDGVPMVRDVLPPWIQLVPGSFSIPPATNYVNGTGHRILEWNISSLGIGESWEVTFRVKSLDIGMLLANEVSPSRVYFVDYFDVTNFFLFPEVWLEVLPSAPLPPKLYIDRGLTDNDIMLYWDIPLSPGTENYLIYRSQTPTGFDFSTPWVDTNSTLTGIDPVDGLRKALRRTWNHTNANDGTDEQWYYVMRSVNNLGEISRSSRTVGKWTKDFPQDVTTFSLPLEPLATVNKMASNYLSDMSARYIKWMHPSNHVWMQYGDGGTDDALLTMGKGYEVAFDTPTKYTFLGMPGSHVQFNGDSFGGFDPDTEAKSLTANVNIAGDVTLQWDIPSDPNVINVSIYRSTTRDGFDDGSATFMTSFSKTIFFWIDNGAALAGTELYYMVVPENATGQQGSTTYSIGVITLDISIVYDTIGIPLQTTTQTADWYCDLIQGSSGINYYIETDQRWSWHSTIMPGGAFDPQMIMTEGYQVSTNIQTKYTFIGR